MLDIKNAIRIETYKSPKGWPLKVYIFECITCKREMKKSQYYAKKSTGYCTHCISAVIHTKERIEIIEQKCRLCDIIRPVFEFNKRNGIIRKECKHCVNIKSQFGITAIEYDNILISQNNGCAICKETFSHKHQNGKAAKLAVDHCHVTGKIRGLLCSKCNMGLGLFRDNVDFLNEAVNYLKLTGVIPGKNKK